MAGSLRRRCGTQRGPNASDPDTAINLHDQWKLPARTGAPARARPAKAEPGAGSAGRGGA